MPDYNLRLIVETIKKGSGAQNSQKEVDQLGRKLNQFGTQADRAGIRSAALARKQDELAKQVAKGGITVDKAADKLAKFREALPVEEMDQATKSTGGLSARFGEGAVTMAKFTGAAALASVTIKKALDFGEAGAQLTQLRESFEGLNERVLKTPNLLEDMQIASRNTVSEIQIMQGVMTLTAGASDDLARKLAEASPRLLEIAKAANKVNPLLGDTAFLYESIALGVKRGSPLILDNLGIMVKVGEANKKYAESLGKTVQELTVQEKQMALLNETMRAGDKLIDQAGGNVDAQGDAYAQLGTRIQGFKDDALEMAHAIVGPVVSSFMGVTAQADVAAAAIDRWLDEKDSRTVEEYRERLNELKQDFVELGGIRPTLSPFAAEGNVSQMHTGVTFLAAALHDLDVESGNTEKASTELRRLGLVVSDLGTTIGTGPGSIPVSFVALNAELKKLEAAKFARGLEQADQVMLQYGEDTDFTATKVNSLAEEQKALANQLKTIELKELMADLGVTNDEYVRLSIRLGGTAKAQEFLLAVQKDAVTATDTQAEGIGELNEVLDDGMTQLEEYTEKQAGLLAWVLDNRDAIDEEKRAILGLGDVRFPKFEGPSLEGRAAYEISIETTAAKADIADINNDLDNVAGAYEATVDTRLTGMTEEEIANINSTFDALDPLYTTEVKTKAEVAQSDIDQLNAGLDIFNTADGAGTWAAEMDTNAPAIKQEQLDPVQAWLDGIQEGNPYPVTLNTNTQDELDLIDEMTRKLGQFPDPVVTVTVNYVTDGEPPPGRATGGDTVAERLYRVGEKGPEYFMSDVAGQITQTAPNDGASATSRIPTMAAGGDNRKLHIENLIVNVPGMNVSPRDAAGSIVNDLASMWSG